MLDFARKSTTPDYLSSRQQRRMLLLVMLIGLPLIAVMRFVDFQTQPEASANASAAIDPRLPEPAAAPVDPDAFTSPPQIGEAAEDETGRFFRGVKPDYLSVVRDDTPSRGVEREAFFNLLEVLKRTPDEQLRAASLGPTAYVQLFQQPEVYRGKLVDVAGRVRRAHRLPLEKNTAGLTENFQLYLSPKDAAANPIVVYCLELPDEFPTGMNVNEPVELTGFFFKRWAYSARSGYMSAPMLVAKTVRWKNDAATSQQTADGVSPIGWSIVVGVVCVLAMFALFLSQRWAGRATLSRPTLSPECIESLKNAAPRTVEEELQRLSREGP